MANYEEANYDESPCACCKSLNVDVVQKMTTNVSYTGSCVICLENLRLVPRNEAQVPLFSCTEHPRAGVLVCERHIDSPRYVCDHYCDFGLQLLSRDQFKVGNFEPEVHETLQPFLWFLQTTKKQPEDPHYQFSISQAAFKTRSRDNGLQYLSYAFVDSQGGGSFHIKKGYLKFDVGSLSVCFA